MNKQDKSFASDDGNSAMLKVLWVHTFKTNESTSGIFMKRWFNSLTKMDITVQQTSFSFDILNIYKNYKSLKKMSCQYDLVHAQYGSGCGLIVSFLPSKKILSLRGSDLHFYFNLQHPLTTIHSLISNTLTRISIRKYDHIICVSDSMKNRINKKFHKKVSVIPCPIDLNEFYPINREFAREKIGFGNDLKIWMTFASVNIDNNIKNFHLAYQSYCKVKSFLPDVELRVISKVEPSDVVYWMNASNVIIMTSVYEGWPNVIKEALACNIPFVSTDVSDLRELSKKANNCFVCDNNSDDLSEKILRSISLPSENLRALVENMDMPVANRELVRIYGSVVNLTSYHYHYQKQ